MLPTLYTVYDSNNTALQIYARSLAKPGKPIYTIVKGYAGNMPTLNPYDYISYDSQLASLVGQIVKFQISPNWNSQFVDLKVSAYGSGYFLSP